MKIIRTPHQMRQWRLSQPNSRSIGFVPTMGALHEGHLTLIRRARKENKICLVSVFVNPTQFGPNEDYSRYPRPWNRDKKLLIKEGVDVVFTPAAASMYGPNARTSVVVRELTDHLCGAPTSRGPGHFTGVATVVTKLFNLVRPERAYFGLKDFQQVRVIEQMNEDLNMGIQIVRVPTVREKDGLAMSSRNAYLSAEERAAAPRLYQALQQGRKLLTSRPMMKPRQVREAILAFLSSTPIIKTEYIELVDPESLIPRSRPGRPVLLAAAVRIGRTRLIDNLLVR